MVVTGSRRNPGDEGRRIRLHGEDGENGNPESAPPVLDLGEVFAKEGGGDRNCIEQVGDRTGNCDGESGRGRRPLRLEPSGFRDTEPCSGGFGNGVRWLAEKVCGFDGIAGVVLVIGAKGGGFILWRRELGGFGGRIGGSEIHSEAGEPVSL